ncbi:hypothetical protein CYMTET_31469 [Cymbomonas tetramitiformis]|uniref:Uncharacterized protein n=1 Tax=Cymbomonas tetramitiformis TaxID=36881 RepID=A0AAE0FH23_9CHLO|nr:hypothetical protein CYMTET_31469 [Cymbomonas tetramitiformis]
MDYTSQDIMLMALQSATQIKICTAGSETDCVVSRKQTFPIQMLRQGKTVSHDDAAKCNQACVDQVWIGNADRVANNLWNRDDCADGRYTGALDGSANFYWACRNSNGLHLSVNDGGFSGWTWQGGRGDDGIEVFIDAVPIGDMLAHHSNLGSLSKLTVKIDLPKMDTMS